MTRQEIIDKLVQDDINDVRQGIFNSDFAFITDVLTNGWVGLKYWTNEELRDEYNARFAEDYYDVIEVAG